MLYLHTKSASPVFRSYKRMQHRRLVRTRYCDSIPGNGIYDPFFDLYIRAVCMQPVYGTQGSPECLNSLTLPPVETQMEIVEAIQMYSYIMNIDPIKGLLVRLMLNDDVGGIQDALSALSDHYQALERLQSLIDQS